MNHFDKLHEAQEKVESLRQVNSPGQTPAYWSAVAEKVRVRCKGHKDELASSKDRDSQIMDELVPLQTLITD